MLRSPDGRRHRHGIGVQEAERCQGAADLVERLVGARRDFHGLANGDTAEIDLDGVVAVGGVHRLRRLEREHRGLGAQDEHDGPREGTAASQVRDAARLGDGLDRDAQRGLGDHEARLGLGGRAAAGLVGAGGAGRARRAAAPGELVRLGLAVLRALGDRVDGADDHVGPEVAHEQVIARLDAVRDELPVAPGLGPVVAHGADVDALDGGLDGARVHAVIAHAVEVHPALTGRLVDRDVGRDRDHDIGRDRVRGLGDAGRAGEGGGHEGQGGGERLDRAVHGALFLLWVALVDGCPALI